MNQKTQICENINEQIMALVMNSTMNETQTKDEVMDTHISKQTKVEALKLIQSKTVTDVSPMPEDLKKRVSENAPPMSELFEEVVKQKGELASLEKVGENTFRINDISKMALHTFALRAQEYGKDVSYTKETIITIS